jgi:hypothetical protein
VTGYRPASTGANPGPARTRHLCIYTTDVAHLYVVAHADERALANIFLQRASAMCIHDVSL